MQSTVSFQIHLRPEQECTYFRHAFFVPENVSRIDIAYQYERYSQVQQEINIVDLALCDSNGNYIGASGSTRDRIHISAVDSTPGYTRTPISSGPWSIIAGAYKVAPQGVCVSYTVTFTFQSPKLFLGDLHTHSIASDGSLTTSQLLKAAHTRGLDFLFVTDHNNFACDSLPRTEYEVCLYPGVEWTHYKGHSGMLGIARPFLMPFCTSCSEDPLTKLEEARRNSALVVMNHPFSPTCGWHFPFDLEKFDLIEAWNGAAPEAANQACVDWWHAQLCSGRHLPIIGGSDFHRSYSNSQLGHPTTAVYAMSSALPDIIAALQHGNCYLKGSPSGPDFLIESKHVTLGSTVLPGESIFIRLTHLSGRETLQVITDTDSMKLPCSKGEMTFTYSYANAAFVRFELRMEGKLLLLTNPIYFDRREEGHHV